MIAKYDYELSAIDGIGLTDVEMDATLTLLLDHVQVAARGLTEAAQVADRTGISDEQWWAANAPLLSRMLDPGKYPTAIRVGAVAGEAYGAGDPEHAFAFGLARILDGLEALVADRANG